MKDYNDYFDELIDDEAEADATQYFDDDDAEEEDDDEPSDVRTVLLTKNDLLAMLSLKTNDRGGQIVRFDPRESLPAAQRYDDPEAASKWFRRSLATSRQNGWSVFYDGEPLFG